MFAASSSLNGRSTVRIESSVTAISWIPSEAVKGLPKLPFTMGVARPLDIRQGAREILIVAESPVAALARRRAGSEAGVSPRR
jgi:hypothetical protein